MIVFFIVYNMVSSYVFHFRVAEHSHANQMNAANLAIVFGPTLLRPE